MVSIPLCVFLDVYKRQPIDSWGDAPATANTFAYQVYDNEPLSYFIASKPGARVTVDFGKVVTIDNFMYMPRNDDNFVSIGDYYELFYWGEGCWNSLGKKMAEKPFLPYDMIRMPCKNVARPRISL